jgi:hypothetical protein
MNTHIPTASEFLESQRIYPHTVAEWECPAVYGVMVEFAKLHVQLALESAKYVCDSKEVSSMDVNEYYRECITKSYPLENIKSER